MDGLIKFQTVFIKSSINVIPREFYGQFFPCHVINPHEAPRFHHIYSIFFLSRNHNRPFLLKAKKFPNQNHTPNVQRIVNKQVQNPNPPSPNSSRFDSQKDKHRLPRGSRRGKGFFFIGLLPLPQHPPAPLLRLPSRFHVHPHRKDQPRSDPVLLLDGPGNRRSHGPQLATDGFCVNLWGFFHVNLAPSFDWI
jgi:hypothetical protein